MTEPSTSSSQDVAVMDEGHADDETTFVSVGSENLMSVSPTRFVDTSDSCSLCSMAVGNEAQVRLKCGHQYHLSCWMRRMRFTPECVKCTPECCDETNIPSPICASTNIDDRLLKQFALRAYTLLQNNSGYRQASEA